MKRTFIALAMTAVCSLSAADPSEQNARRIMTSFETQITTSTLPFDVLLGIDSGASTLLRINRFTGQAFRVGNLGNLPFPSMAVDPSTGVVYAGTGGGSGSLFTVNPLTAELTFLSATNLGFAAIGSMDFGPNGNLYASVNIVGDGGTGSDHLAILDKLTGQATILGPYGACQNNVPIPVPVPAPGACTIEGMEGIAFDLAGNLWGTLSVRGAAGLPGLYSINPVTGAAQFVSPLVDGMGFPASGGIVSLQGTPDGLLYGGTARAVGQANDGGRLVTINTQTGVFAYVGTASLTQGGSLGALALPNPVTVLQAKSWQRYD